VLRCCGAAVLRCYAKRVMYLVGCAVPPMVPRGTTRCQPCRAASSTHSNIGQSCPTRLLYHASSSTSRHTPPPAHRRLTAEPSSTPNPPASQPLSLLFPNQCTDASMTSRWTSFESEPSCADVEAAIGRSHGTNDDMSATPSTIGHAAHPIGLRLVRIRGNTTAIAFTSTCPWASRLSHGVMAAPTQAQLTGRLP
jgi:hypothetical protein